jgi:hypothetical protein
MTDAIPTPTKAELLPRMAQAWGALQAFVRAHSEADLTGPTDAAGWTALDHLHHMVVWEDGVLALLAHQPRHVRMNVPLDVWQTHDDDAINAVIRAQRGATTVAEVTARHHTVHAELLAVLERMSDDELAQPYAAYDPASDSPNPVIWNVIGNTVLHYPDHVQWMTAIVQGGQA